MELHRTARNMLHSGLLSLFIICTSVVFRAENTDPVHQITSQYISLPLCAKKFRFPGLKIDQNLRIVRSQIECASLCSMSQTCKAYNLVKQVNRSASGRLHECELLQTFATACGDLEQVSGAEYKYSILAADIGEDDTTTYQTTSTTTEDDTTTYQTTSTTTEEETTTYQTTSTTTEEDTTTYGITSTTTEEDTTTYQTTSTTTEEDTTTYETTSTTTEEDTTTIQTTFTTTEEDTTTYQTTSTTTEEETTTEQTTSTTTEDETTTYQTTSTTSEKDTTTYQTTSTTTEEDTTTYETTSTTTEEDTTTYQTTSTTTEEETTTYETTSTTPKYFDIEEACTQTWSLVYRTYSSQRSSGSLEDLKTQLQGGAAILIKLTGSASTRTYLIKAHEFDVTKSEVCAKIPFYVQTKAWNDLGSTSQWTFSKICTSGTQESYSPSDSKTTTVSDVTALWYARPNNCSRTSSACTGSQYVLTNLHNGDISQGDKDTFRKHIAQGDSVSLIYHDINLGQGKQTDEIPDTHSVYLSQTILMDDTDTEVGALNTWSFYEETTGKQTSTLDLDLKLTWTSGSDCSLALPLNQKTSGSQGASCSKTKYSWVTDPCWKHVYTNDHGNAGDNSKSTATSHEDLVSAVSQGHTVRVTVKDTGYTRYVEADNIVVTNQGIVVAQILSNVVTEDANFNNQGLWSWYFIHSNGYQCQHQVYISTLQEYSSSCEEMAVSWFIDTRQHDVILETDVTGQIITGSKEELKTSLGSAAELRIKVSLPNENGMTRYLTPETVELGTEAEVSALSMRILSTTFDNNGRMTLSKSTGGISILVTSDGGVQVSNWGVGYLGKLDVKTSQKADVKWFISR